jgi:hypothetical protein
MISASTIAAFTQDISRSIGIGSPRVDPMRQMELPRVDVASASPQKRLLEVPASPPAGNLPRGSLLDLRA